MGMKNNKEGVLTYRNYHASFTYSDEDKLDIGKVIGIKDTLLFHGSSFSETEEMFHQSIDNYLEICQEFGKDVGKE